MSALPPIATKHSRRSETTRCARTGLMRRSKTDLHSISSSAATNSLSATVNRPCTQI